LAHLLFVIVSSSSWPLNVVDECGGLGLTVCFGSESEGVDELAAAVKLIGNGNVCMQTVTNNSRARDETKKCFVSWAFPLLNLQNQLQCLGHRRFLK
jgi:hypothetical protein